MSAISQNISPAERRLDHQGDLRKGLGPFRRRMITVACARVALLGAAAIVLALLLVMWLDTVWALSTELRWFSTRVALPAAGAALLTAAWWRSTAFTYERIADQIDRSVGSGGEILAGWQLATRPVHPQGDLSRGFAAITARHAIDRLRILTPGVITDVTHIQRAAISLATILTIGTVIAVCAPNVAQHQLQRFLYPDHDVPPYTGVSIDLQLEKDTVLYGEDAFVTAQVVAGRVDDMSLVVRSDDAKEHALPMLAQSERQWQAILTRITEPLTIYARAGASRSRLHRLEVQMTPKILPPRIKLTPPEYTRGSVYSGPIPQQGLIGLRGTTVEWQVESNRPLREGQLTIHYRDGDSEQVTLAPAQSNDQSAPVVGRLTLSRPGKFELKVTDIDGLQSQESVSGSITILEDRRPIVRIIQPKPMSLATPDISLPVTVLAEDDYGISRLTLYRSLNGSPAFPIAGAVDGAAQVEAQWDLPLASFGLEPDDEIQLFARTEDNDPSGVKGAESPITTIRIISVEQYQEMMLQQRGAEAIQAKYQAARRYFDQLASELRDVQEAQAAAAANPDSQEAAEALQQKLEAAQQAAEQAANEIAKLSKQAMPIDVDRQLAKKLEEMSQQAGSMAEQLAKMRASEPASLSEEDEKQLSEMLQQAGQAQQEVTEQAIEPLAKMQQIMPLLIDEQRYKQIVQQQRDLSERMNALQEQEADKQALERRTAELESEQEQLRQSLDQLFDDIEAHAEALPEDPELEKLRTTALEFAGAVRESQAQAEMASSQQNLLDQNFTDAQQNASKAADILESFLSRCEGMGGAGCKSCEAAFSPSADPTTVRNSIEQMLASMGLKPGSSGMRPGGKPGMGLGWGAGGGFAQRFPGPQNVGMYGSLPLAQASPGRGSGDRQTQGVQTSQAIDAASGGTSDGQAQSKGDPSGQSMTAVPANYRARVAEYFRQLNETLHDAESKR